MRFRPVRLRYVRRTFAALGVLSCVTAVALAQRFRQFAERDIEVHNVPYDGRFTFVRLKYTTGPGGFYYYGIPGWAHGFGYDPAPAQERAGRNLMKILNEIAILRPRLDGSNVLALDDPELCKYPVAYMTEAGYWTMTDAEALALRAYLQKGGFIIFDDSRDPPRGGGGWDNFEEQMRRVIPEGQFVDLQPSAAIFHSFYDIDSFDIIPQDYDRGRPVLRGLFEDNDPKKRLMVMVNYNTDVSNFWEFSDEGFAPIELSNEAYKLGVNYIMYGLTH
jgi:uncharacterized protein DUF4159